ncbi:MAG: helix-turn-helix transcriptional regulator [bacterium]|nr:helix-turn-helix transcriptional regulator [bacterium]
MLGDSLAHYNPDEGRTDEQGNQEFLIETTGGPTKYYNKRRKRNPTFNDPDLIKRPRIDEAWYKEMATGLRQERLWQHLSQQTLAQKLATNQSVISNLERGKTNPSLLFLQNYAQALGKKIKIVLVD